MVTGFILLIVYYFLVVLLSPFYLVDDVSVESGFGSAIHSASEYLANINQVFPLSTLFTIFLIILSIEGILASYKIIMWVVRRFPTQS